MILLESLAVDHVTFIVKGPVPKGVGTGSTASVDGGPGGLGIGPVGGGPGGQGISPVGGGSGAAIPDEPDGSLCSESW